MYVDINEYIKKTREERRNHLNLSENCICIGGIAYQWKSVLAHYVKTNIPNNSKNVKEIKVLLCHACNNNKCSNPKHLYWGTNLDNFQDYKESDHYKSVWQKLVDKHGIDGAKKIRSKEPWNKGKICPDISKRMKGNKNKTGKYKKK